MERNRLVASDREVTALTRGGGGTLSHEGRPAWGGRIHVVGVGGSGLQRMARLLQQRGAEITGSDLSDSPTLASIRESGIDCRVGHSEGNLKQGTGLVLVSAAVDSSNPEVQAARLRRIPVWKYSECLGRLMAEKTGIAVAGTHGKTTTTAMVSHVLHAAGLDPSFIIGGEYPSLGGGSNWGKGQYFVAEACEYDHSFLNLRPQVAVVTNVEEEHLDYFRGLSEIQQAFIEFSSLLPADGHIVVSAGPTTEFLRRVAPCATTTFGMEAGASEWWVENIVYQGLGAKFDVVHRTGERVPICLVVPGEHNVKNAAATVALCRHLGVRPADIRAGLRAFTGVRRRFDVLARGPVAVVDDYAHHPTEIEAVQSAARVSFPRRKLTAVFQPHQHSRLRHFMRRFADALADFDRIFVLDVFQARDEKKEIESVQSDRLVQALQDRGRGARWTSTFDDVLAALAQDVSDDSAVIFLGAGDITSLAHKYAAVRTRGAVCTSTSLSA